MSDNFKLLRFYLVLLAIFTVGRWGLSFADVQYADVREVFSIVILCVISSLYYGGFARHFEGAPLKRAATLGALIGLTAQIVILLSTALSYGLGLDTFFNNSQAVARTADSLSFGQAMGQRVVGLVINTILNAIMASIGYAIGGVMPKDGAAA